MGRALAGVVALVFALSAAGLVGYQYARVGAGGQQVASAAGSGGLNLRVDSAAIPNAGAIADAAARISPSVVTLNTEYRARPQFADTPFGLVPTPGRMPRGTGSGVILTSDGVIVTNNHVVENATKINVTMQDGRELVGRVVGADQTSDIAVVKVDEKNLPAATLADSAKLRVGEWVVAVGDPLGVGPTVTAGIVSALHKQGEANRRLPISSAIQTDAAINPGNSGGALADIAGRLIGINTAIASPNGGNVGIGFAIPVNTVREVTDQLIKQGRVVRPWLGVYFGPITDRARSGLNIPADVDGVIVAEVVPGGPADAAGVRQGDVVMKANDTTIKQSEELQTVVQGLKVDDAVALTLWRQGSTVNVKATLRERSREAVVE